MIKLEHLKQLLAFSKYGTLSETAEKLYISQPALSRSIQNLEKQLNVELFERKKNKISLNKNGKTVIKYSREIMNLINEMQEKISADSKSQNNFMIGSCAPAPLWDMVLLFSKFYPEKYIIHKMESNSQLLEKLKNGDYQMVILSEPVDDPEIHCVKYKTEELLLSVPLNHELADKKGVYFSEIRDEKMPLFNPSGIWEDVVFKNMPNMKFLIQKDRVIFKELAEAHGLLSFRSNLTIIREENFKNNVLIPILDEEAKITFYCACKKDIKNKINKIFDEF